MRYVSSKGFVSSRLFRQKLLVKNCQCNCYHVAEQHFFTYSEIQDIIIENPTSDTNVTLVTAILTIFNSYLTTPLFVAHISKHSSCKNRLKGIKI